MGGALTGHVLQSIALRAGRQRRVVVATSTALALGLLALGALAGLAFALAVLLAIVVVGLALRLRSVERSCAALALSVNELTARVDRLPADVGDAPPVAGVVAEDHAEVTGSNGGTDEAIGTGSPEDNVGSPIALAVGGDTHDEATRADIAGRRADALAPATQESVVEAAGSDGADSEVLVVGPDPAAAGASPVLVEETVGPDAIPPVTPDALPAFALPSLRGDTVTAAGLAGRAAVFVFWRPGCPHCQRLTPELVAWESLQGPRLVVIAACDGPAAFRAGLPGTVLLDPGFTVGQALGAPGTPAAVPIDAAARPTGPVVAGSAAVTALLLVAMRDWAATDIEPEATEADGDVATAVALSMNVLAPAVLLRRVEERQPDDAAVLPDWDADAVSRRAG